MTRRLILIAAVLAAAVFAGCGGTTSTTTVTRTTTRPTLLPPAALTCVTGTMGCALHSSNPSLTSPIKVAGKTLIPDVSEFQACALHSEAIFRVYEAGTEREDAAARCHAQELHRLHAWAGAYAFLRSSRSCTGTADATVRIVKSLPVSVKVIIGDAETGIREGKVRCFLREVERLGYPAREYTCPGCGDEQVGPIWVASYPTRPRGRWIAHQFSDNFNCRGVTGDCSIDEGLLSIGKPTPKPPTKRQRRAHAEQQAAVLLADLHRHGCFHVHGKRAFRLCPRWGGLWRREVSRVHALR